MTRRPVVAFVREVVTQWQHDRVLSHGAALAYYALFSLAPLLILVIAIVGLAFGRAAAEACYSDEWKAMVAAKYGVRPEIVYMAAPVTVDNVSHQILA